MTVVPEPSKERKKLGLIAYLAAHVDEAPTSRAEEPGGGTGAAYRERWADAGSHLREYWCAIADAVATAVMDEHAAIRRHGRFCECWTCRKERGEP